MAVTLGSGTVVTVFGGSGFLGRYVVQALAKTGTRVVAAVRRPDLALALQTYGNVGQIAIKQANVRDDASVARACAGADAVVNLVGILAPHGRQKFPAVHAEGAARVAKFAKEAGAAAMVHVSAIGANRNSKSAYARTKGEGEERVLKAFPEAVILRPSIIFGPEDEFFNRFAAMARLAPFIPLFGAQTRFQPVYAGDVAQAVIASLSGRARAGSVYELGGPKAYSFAELIKKIGAWTLHPRPILPIPFWLAKLPVFFLQYLPGAPITYDQLLLLQRDNVVSEEAKRALRTFEGLGLSELRSVDLIVPSYLQRFRPQGEFSVGETAAG